jgi:heme exporter protein CcmD
MWEHLSFAPYGWFVWPSLGLFIGTIAVLVAVSLSASARVKRQLERLERKDP